VREASKNNVINYYKTDELLFIMLLSLMEVSLTPETYMFQLIPEGEGL